jgi:histone acetyltransferase (RNA polymerase elongator complex component)
MPPKHFTIPIFIPHAGCRFDCIFCNQKRISGIKLPSPVNNISLIINEHLKTINPDNAIIEIGFLGGSFTGIKQSLQEEYLSIAYDFIKKGLVKSIRLSTRPDYINQNNLNLLKNFGVKTIELGVQSLDNEVLLKSGRGHNVMDVEKAAKLIKQNDFNLGMQMMIGLPYDNYQKALMTAQGIIDMKANCVRIYPVLVIKDTELEQLFYKNEYHPLSLEEAVYITKNIVLLFESANVKIIRVGLHPSEDLISNQGFICGPFHISFKELVLTEIWNDLLQKLYIPNKERNITIYTSPKEINYAIGYKSKNKKKLFNYYKKVKFEIDYNLFGRQYNVDIY